METKPKPFNVKLSDDDRAKLEAYRAKHGLRSEADAVRHLIDAASGPKPAAVAVAVPPRPETSKPAFVSRLKGEWKPK